MNLFLLAGAISVGFAGELRTQVLDLLGGYEETASPASLQALGPTVSDELLSIAQDSTVPASRRARAVHALGWFPSDTTRTFLVGTLQGADSTLARKAAYALANGWRDEALSVLDPALASSDPQLRIATGQALGSIKSAASLDRLQRRLQVETDPAVREALTKAVGG